MPSNITSFSGSSTAGDKLLICDTAGKLHTILADAVTASITNALTANIAGISIATSGLSSALAIFDYPYWDYQSLAYSGTATTVLTSVTMKVGGAGGTTVGVTTIAYDSTTLDITSVTRT